jgi:RimJ/RimL family protein N-acetyltransferase
MVTLAPTVGVRLLYAQCHPDHRASWRVLEKAGLTREAELHAHPGFPNLPDGGPTRVLRYSLRFEDAA